MPIQPVAWVSRGLNSGVSDSCAEPRPPAPPAKFNRGRTSPVSCQSVCDKYRPHFGFQFWSFADFISTTVLKTVRCQRTKHRIMAAVERRLHTYVSQARVLPCGIQIKVLKTFQVVPTSLGPERKLQEETAIFRQNGHMPRQLPSEERTK